MQFFTRGLTRPAIDEGPVGKLEFEWWAVDHLPTKHPLPQGFDRCPYYGMRFTSYRSVIEYMIMMHNKLVAERRVNTDLSIVIATHKIYRVEEHEG